MLILKKLIAFLLAGSVFISMSFNTIAEYGQQKSEMASHWASQEIGRWIDLGIIKGYGDGSFKPDNPVTRAEFVTFIQRLFGYIEKAENKFTDVPENAWYTSAVLKSVKAGIVSGYENSTFKPDARISRQEAAVILYRAFELKSSGNTAESELKDYKMLEGWSKEAIDSLVGKGYISGRPGGLFSPRENITRAETVKLLDNMVKDIKNLKGTYTGEIKGNLVVSTGEVILKDMTIKGDLYLAQGIGEGEVTLENVKVNGRMLVHGGGPNSIVLKNSNVSGQLLVYKSNGNIRIVAQGATTIGGSQIGSGGRIFNGTGNSNAFGSLQVLSVAAGSQIVLDGDFGEVSVEAAGVRLDIQDGSVQSLTAANRAEGTGINIAMGSYVNTLTANGAINVSGSGTITTANINSKDVTIENPVERIVTTNGIQATRVNGKIVSNGSEAISTGNSGSRSNTGGNTGTSGTYTVVLQQGLNDYDGCQDATIKIVRTDADNSNTNQVDHGELYSGNGSSESIVTGIAEPVMTSYVNSVNTSYDTTEYRTLMSFDLNPIPSNAEITKAELSLFYNDFSSIMWIDGNQHPILDINKKFNIKDVVEPWVEDNQAGISGVSWSSRPEEGAQVIENPTALACYPSFWYTSDITSLVSKWVNHTEANYGFEIIEGDNPGLVPTANCIILGSHEYHWNYGTRSFASSNNQTQNLRPQLTITYKIPDGETAAPTSAPSPKFSPSPAPIPEPRQKVVVNDYGVYWTKSDNQLWGFGKSMSEDSQYGLTKGITYPVLMNGSNPAKIDIAGNGDGDCYGINTDGGFVDWKKLPIEYNGDILGTAWNNGFIDSLRCPKKQVVAGIKFGAYLKTNGDMVVWQIDQENFPSDAIIPVNQTIKSTTPERGHFLKSIAAYGDIIYGLTDYGRMRRWKVKDLDDMGNLRNLSSFPSVVLEEQLSGNFDDVSTIALGDSFVLLLKNDGSVWAKGNNSYGQLGIGTYYNAGSFEKLNCFQNTHITKITAYGKHVLALDSEGEVYTWGYGLLGIGSIFESNVPVHISDLHNVIDIATGNYYSAAITSSGKVFAWGDNSKGQLCQGNYDFKAPTKLANIVGRLKEVKTGNNSSIFNFEDKAAFSGGYPYIWLGTTPGSMLEVYDPVYFNNNPSDLGIPNCKEVSSGYFSSMALDANGKVWTWGILCGNNSLGYDDAQIDIHDLMKVYPPRQLDGLDNITSIYCGSNSSFAVRNDGRVFGWGTAQIGDNIADRWMTPVLIPEQKLSNIKKVESGIESAIALRNDGKVLSWGSNAHGALGRAVSGSDSTPAVIPGLNNIIAICNRVDSCMAVDSNGDLYTWGSNNNGRLGHGISDPYVSTPKKVTAIKNVKFISAGYNKMAAVLEDGTLWLWGSKSFDFTKDDDKGINNIPIKVPSLNNIQSVSVGKNQIFAIGEDADTHEQVLWGWGSNKFGELGYEVSTMIQSPMEVKTNPLEWRTVPVPVAPEMPSILKAETNQTGTEITLTFDKSMANPSGKQEEFAVKVNNLRRVITAASSDSRNDKIDLVLSEAVSNGDEVNVSYTKGTILASDGSSLDSFTNFSVINNSTASLASLVSAQTDTLGIYVILAFNKPMADPTGKQGQFKVTVNNANRVMSAAALDAGDNKKIKLMVSSLIMNGDAVTVSYSQGDIQASDGGLLQNFTNLQVTNNVPAPAAEPHLMGAETNSSGTAVILAFDKPMADPAGKQGQFALSIAGYVYGIHSAAYNPGENFIYLNLSDTITYGKTITVSYSPGDIASADGGALAAFNNYPVTNKVPLSVATLYEYVATIGDYGMGDGKLRGPKASALDPNGSIYVVDAGNNRIEKFAPDGTFVSKWNGFNNPTDIAIDKDGNVYVSDSGNHIVKKLLSGASDFTDVGSEGNGNGQFKSPKGVAVDSLGNLYVVDSQNRNLQIFNSSGTFAAKWTNNLSNIDPYGLAVGSDGSIYITDQGGNQVLKLNSSGDLLTRWGSWGSGDGKLNYPCGIAIDALGYVYVADSYNNRIQKFDSSGKFICKWGTHGGNPGQLDEPCGVTVDSNGNVYVADKNNHWIQKFKVKPD